MKKSHEINRVLTIIILLAVIVTAGSFYIYGAGSPDRDVYALVYREDSKSYRFTIRNAYTYDAVDLTGYVVKFRVKKNPSDITYTIDKTCTLSDAENGQATVTLSTSDTSIDTGTYYAYIVLTNEGSTLYETLLKSKWKVTQ